MHVREKTIFELPVKIFADAPWSGDGRRTASARNWTGRSRTTELQSSVTTASRPVIGKEIALNFPRSVRTKTFAVCLPGNPRR